MTETGTKIVQTAGLDHIVLHVNDMERSKAFYIGILGMAIYRERDGHCFLRCGTNQLALFEARGGEKASGYTEFDHIALKVSASTEEEIKAVLVERGVELLARGEGLGWDPTPGVGIYVRDPDGHRIQLLPPADWDS
jgi:catechol 2,3-dioxygenase-like lactoylglutathione lyase family enzyme